LTVRSAVIVVLAVLTGCMPSTGMGKLRTESLGPDAVSLDAVLPVAVYAHEPGGDTSFILTDVPVEDLLAGRPTTGQVLHIELLWEPNAGRTPMDPSATNTTVRHVLLVDGQLGLYGGAGFAVPKGKIGRGKLKVSVRDTNVRLLEATDGFADPLSPARLLGTFTAVPDSGLTRKLQRALSQLVTNEFGATRFVDAAPTGPVALGAR
jgi:hypothetical protein